MAIKGGIKGLAEMAEEHGVKIGQMRVLLLAAAARQIEEWRPYYEKDLVPPGFLKMSGADFRQLYIAALADFAKVEAEFYPYTFPKLRQTDLQGEVQGSLVVEIVKHAAD